MSTNRKPRRNPAAADRRVVERAARLAALRDGNRGAKAWRQKNGRALASKNACRGR